MDLESQALTSHIYHRETFKSCRSNMEHDTDGSAEAELGRDKAEENRPNSLMGIPEHFLSGFQ